MLGSIDFEYELLLCLGPMHIQDGSNTLAIFIYYMLYHLNRERSSRCVCVNKQERVSLLFLINLMEKIRTRDQMREIFIRAVFSAKNTDKKSDF